MNTGTFFYPFLNNPIWVIGVVRRIVILSVIFPLSAGFQESIAQGFIEKSQTLDILHLHVNGVLMGGGAVFLDYDNDGWEDLFLTGGARQDRLYRNLFGEKFEEVTNLVGISKPGAVITNGAVAGDLDNDGFQDILVLTFKGQPNLLYKNMGNNRFKEVGQSAGITGRAWSMGAALGDINQDGYLDIYVINYIEENGIIVDERDSVVGFDHICSPNQLYLNNQDGTFTEVSQVYQADDIGCGLAVTLTDYDQDNDLDLYIANDFGAWIRPDQLLENNYPEVGFTNKSSQSGLDAAIYGMGIATGDYNRDGLLDYYVTNIGRNVLHQNLGAGLFEDVTDHTGVANTFAPDGNATSWGTFFFDYDHDGFLDLFVSNGFVSSAPFLNTSQNDPNKIFRGSPGFVFEDLSEDLQIANDWNGRGAAFSDFDNDGDLDICVATTFLDTGSPDQIFALFYENEVPKQGEWIKVILEGTISNKDAIGTKLKAWVDNKVFITEIQAGGSHASQNSRIAHFGLGPYHAIDSMIVIWPSGNIQKLEQVKTSSTYFLKENSAELLVAGCSDPQALNFNPEAEFNTGCSYEIIWGCMDPKALNFDPLAQADDETCEYRSPPPLVTDIPEIEEKKVELHPNPFGSQIWIIPNQFKDEKIAFRLLNAKGQLVFSKEYILNGEPLVTQPDVAPGLYLCQIYNHEGRILIKKRVIKR